MHMTYIKRGKTSIPALFGKYQCEIYCGSCWFWINYSFPRKSTTYLSFVHGSITVYYVCKRGEGDHLVNAVQVILVKGII